MCRSAQEHCRDCRTKECAGVLKNIAGIAGLKNVQESKNTAGIAGLKNVQESKGAAGIA